MISKNLIKKQKDVNDTLNLAMLRMGRRKNNVSLPQTMGDTIDLIEAKLNDLQLQVSIIIGQTASEVVKSGLIANDLKIQIKLAEDDVLKTLNSYQKNLYDNIYKNVKVSEETLKFKNTDIYDMSFISNLDYSKIKKFNDKSLLESRADNRQIYLAQMKQNKIESLFAQGLISNTDENDSIIADLYNQRNYYTREYYLSAIRYYQECTVIGFLKNPTNNLENLKEFIALNENNLPTQFKSLEFKRLELGEDGYKDELEKLNYAQRMLITAKGRLSYLMDAYNGTWQPPTFDTLKKYANDHNLTYSRVVYELNEQTRYTLCVPDWLLGIAKMYNEVQKFEEPLTELNPYDLRWVRKAREVVNLESEGVKYTAQKLEKALQEYWIVLTMGIQQLEDFHLDAIIAKALTEDETPVGGYVISNDITLVSFDDDVNMGGMFSSIAHTFNSVAKSIAKVTKTVAGQVVHIAQIVTAPVAKLAKVTLDQTLGRILPDSIYKKISKFTEGGLAIMTFHLDKKNFRAVVEGVMDYALIGNRIYAEAFRQADKVGMLHNLIRKTDKYSGGLITSANRLNKVPVTLSQGGKINWKVTLIDSLKVGLAIYGGQTLLASSTATNAVGTETGLNKTSLGAGILSSGMLIATGQSDYTSQLIGGATKVGTNSLVNSTGLKDTKYGRTVAEIGVSATAQSIQSNEAFSQVLRDKAQDKAEELARREADKKIKNATGGIISLNTVTSVTSSVYDFANSDKTISDIVAKSYDVFTGQVDTLVAKAEGLTQEKIESKAGAEADRFVKKEINKAYGAVEKYGDKMFDYLLAKYGPKADYDEVLVPDDFLNYQVVEFKEDDRITNIVYKKNNFAKIGGGIAVMGLLATYSLDS
jgi:hypothetical protein